MMAVNAIRGVIAKAKDLTVNAGKEMTDDAVNLSVSSIAVGEPGAAPTVAYENSLSGPPISYENHPH